MATKYGSLTPYNYSFNMPNMVVDVNGADPADNGGRDPANYWFEESMQRRAAQGKGEPQSNTFNYFDRLFGPSQMMQHFRDVGGGGITRNGNEFTINMSSVGQFGGTWSNEEGYRNFSSGEEALAFAMGQIDRYNGWGGTYYGSRDGTVLAYLWMKATNSVPVRKTIDYHLQRGGSWQGALRDIVNQGWSRWQNEFNAISSGGGPMPETRSGIYNLNDVAAAGATALNYILQNRGTYAAGSSWCNIGVGVWFQTITGSNALLGGKRTTGQEAYLKGSPDFARVAELNDLASLANGGHLIIGVLNKYDSEGKFIEGTGHIVALRPYGTSRCYPKVGYEVPTLSLDTGRTHMCDTWNVALSWKVADLSNVSWYIYKPRN